MPISRTDEFEYIKDNSQISEMYARRLENINNQEKVAFNNKAKMENLINDLKRRTGLEQYINIISSEIEESENTKTAQQNFNSLIDVPYVREAVDKAIDRKQYPSFIILLNDLQKLVIHDEDIPVSLRNAVGDQKLIDYIKAKMGLDKKQEVSYNLTPKEELNEQSQSSSSYFGFMEQDNTK